LSGQILAPLFLTDLSAGETVSTAFQPKDGSNVTDLVPVSHGLMEIMGPHSH
jgi:hypothetical protein